MNCNLTAIFVGIFTVVILGIGGLVTLYMFGVSVLIGWHTSSLIFILVGVAFVLGLAFILNIAWGSFSQDQFGD